MRALLLGVVIVSQGLAQSRAKIDAIVSAATYRPEISWGSLATIWGDNLAAIDMKAPGPSGGPVKWQPP